MPLYWKMPQFGRPSREKNRTHLTITLLHAALYPFLDSLFRHMLHMLSY